MRPKYKGKREDRYVLGTNERINKSHSRKQSTQDLASKTPSTRETHVACTIQQREVDAEEGQGG
jgi:hypothetical protein